MEALPIIHFMEMRVSPTMIRKFLTTLTSRKWPLPPPESSPSNPDQLDFTAALRVRKAQVDELRTRYIEFANLRGVKLWLELLQRTMTVVDDILSAIELQAIESRFETEVCASVRFESLSDSYQVGAHILDRALASPEHADLSSSDIEAVWNEMPGCVERRTNWTVEREFSPRPPIAEEDARSETEVQSRAATAESQTIRTQFLAMIAHGYVSDSQ